MDKAKLLKPGTRNNLVGNEGGPTNSSGVCGTPRLSR